jgi:hypothetical protein
MPIDGLWKDRHGAGFRLEKGRIYTTTQMADGLPPNRVTSKNIQRIREGHYAGVGESHNLKKRLSAYGPLNIDISGVNTIRFTAGPNPDTEYTGATYEWTALRLDNEQAFLSELIEMPEMPARHVADAVQRLTDQALLARLAKTASDASVRKAAVMRVADESILVQVASNDADSGVRQTAVARIKDQALLAEVVIGARDWNVRKIAFGRIHNTAQLGAVESGTTDEAVRMAASVRLGKTTWTDIINEAQKNESKIGPAISAIAWAEKQWALSLQITGLCHRYIRKGDVARVPELRELLLLYGDKALAEDYLNCGQSELDDAGQAWANSHGYNVGTGYGSHRVRWGEDRK